MQYHSSTIQPVLLKKLNFKVNKIHSSSLFILFVQSKSCDGEVTKYRVYRRKRLSKNFLKHTEKA